MECEVCGRRIRSGRFYEVVIDRTVMRVCEACAHLGKPSREISTSGIPSKLEITASPRRTPTKTIPRRSKPRFDLIEYDLVEDFHEIIKKAREERGLTREELAKRLKEKESVIARIERGEMEPSLELARKLERALGIRIVERISEEEIEKLEEIRGGDLELTLGDVARIRKRKKS